MKEIVVKRKFKPENREKCIATAMEKRDWTREEAEYEVDRAVSRLDISYIQYESRFFYTLTDEEQDLRAEHVKWVAAENKKRTQQYIKSTMEKTGWDKEKAKAAMDAAKKTTGVNYEFYDKYDFVNLKEEDQKVRFENIKEEMEEAQENRRLRNLCIWKTMRVRTSDLQQAIDEVEETVQKLGITYKEYDAAYLQRVEPENKEREYKAKLENDKEQDVYRENRFAEAAQGSGKSVQQLEDMCSEYIEVYGCDWEEFLDYKLYDLQEEDIEKLLFLDYMRAISKRYNRDRILTGISADKSKMNKYFDEYYNRKWVVNRDISFEEFRDVFKNEKRVIYKPAFGQKGIGIECIELENDLEGAYNKIMSYPKGVVEEMIRQHPDMKKLNPDSVNCLRFYTVSARNKAVLKDGSKRDLAFVSLKIGRSGSIVDNFSSGGMVTCVDTESGEIITDAVFKNLELVEEHPETKVKIKGFKIPYYKESLEYINRIIEEKGICGTIGWDIAISENGPELVEINCLPGAGSLQGPHWTQRKGMKEYMSKYLWDEE